MSTWIVGLLVAALVFLAARSVMRQSKSGGCSRCGGGCSTCSRSCHTVTPADKPAQQGRKP